MIKKLNLLRKTPIGLLLYYSPICLSITDILRQNVEKYSSIRGFLDKGRREVYFPIQKREKILPKSVSVVTSPVILPKWKSA